MKKDILECGKNEDYIVGLVPGDASMISKIVHNQFTQFILIAKGKRPRLNRCDKGFATFE